MTDAPAQNKSLPLVIIPARLNSRRLPGKLLLKVGGKSVLQHTWEATRRAKRPWAVVVAVDHEDLAADVRRFGGIYEMTDPNLRSGTDRVAAVLRGRMWDAYTIVVNVQADEPEIRPELIDTLIEIVESRPNVDIATAAEPIDDEQLLASPSCVKVVFDSAKRALYFSRSRIPATGRGYRHIGVYAYRTAVLRDLASRAKSFLEEAEDLEQLRALALGYRISIHEASGSNPGIDTPEDFAAFAVRMEQRCKS